MPSNLLGEGILLFTSLSLLAIGMAAIFIPSTSLLSQSSLEEYREGYGYGYRVAILFQEGGYLYLRNIGREISEIRWILLDGVNITSYEVLVNGSWIVNGDVEEGSIIRIRYNRVPDEAVILADENFLIRLEEVV